MNPNNIKTAYFNSFEVNMPAEAVANCSHSGQCDTDVDFWAALIEIKATPAQIRKELKEYGAWDETELSDDEQNKKRIIWIAAGNIKDEMYEEARSLSNL